MKILAINLRRDEMGRVKVKHKFLDVEKETTSYYRVKVTPKSTALVNNRKHIRKDEVDKILFDDPGPISCHTCNFSYISLTVWALLESNEPEYSLLRHWKKKLKECALAELKSRNQELKTLYKQISNL